MHKKAPKVISLVLVLVFCVISLIACGKSSGSASDTDMEQELDGLGKLSQVTLHFLLMGEKKKDSQIVLDEVAARSNLNIKLNFEWYDQDYEQKLKQILASNVPLDAFYIGRPNDIFKTNYINLANNEELKDITGLLPEFAPSIYTKLTKEALSAIKINGKIYTVPSLLPQALYQYTALKSDLMQKHNISSINTFDDYETYLKTVKENEKNIMPGVISMIDTELFARVYDYTVLDNSLGLVYKRDDSKMKLIPWEHTPEFRQVVSFIAKWHKNGYLRKPSDDPNMDDASYLKKGSFYIEGPGKLFSPDDKGNLKETDVYFSPLYPNKSFQRLNPIGDIYGNGAIVFSSKSNNVERALMLLNWIQSNQENYDLFMYGIIGTHYNLEGERISLPSNMDFNNSTYCFWSNGPFKNMEFERISVLDNSLPDSFYKDYLDFINVKTKYAPHEGFTPNYKEIQQQVDKRIQIFSDEISFALRNGTFKEQDIDTIIQKLNDVGTEKIVYEIQNQLDDWVATNK